MATQLSTVALYSASPSRARARKLRTSINNQLQNDLQLALHVASKVFPRSAHLVAATTLDTERHLPPTLFALHWQLDHALRAQDQTAVGVAVAQLEGWLQRQSPYADELDITTVQWNEADVALLRYLLSAKGPRGADGALPEMIPLAEAEHTAARRDVAAALELLEGAAPELAAEFHELVSDVRLMHTRNMGSVSTPRCFGTIYLRCPVSGTERADPVLYFFEPLVHEMSHTALNVVMTHDPLIRNDPAARYYHPLRADNRPMSGIFHGMFVLSRVACAFHALRELDKRDEVPRRLATVHKKFAAAAAVVAEHGILTDAGREVFDSCNALVGHVGGVGEKISLPR